MEITENISPEYAEAFGLEATQAEEQEGAEAEGGTENQPEGSQTAAESEDGSDGGSQEPVTAEGGTEPPARREMSPEERHRQAEARRAREAQERQAAEQQRRDQIFAEMFAGQTNPYTGKPITTEAEFRAYQAEKASREQAQQLQQAGIQPETIRGIVDQQLGPVREQLMRAQMQAAQERARAVNQQAQEVIGAFVKGLSSEWPEIKSMDDIAAMPTAEEFNGYVQMGLSLDKAFYLANRKEIEARKIAAAKTAAIHGVAGKQHLNPVPAGGGSEPVEVPADMRDAYLEMMPGATDAEIKAAYTKFLKDTKKG